MSAITERRFFFAVVILFTLLLFYRLGSWGVLETSEARYAEMSWEMYRTGDLIHPSFMGLRHYHKPPLTYAITAGAYWLFGPSPFAARFFLQIALLLQIALVYGIGRLIYARPRQARLAALVYLSFPILLIASRTLTTDLYLVTFLLLGVWCWLRGERRDKSLWWTLTAYLAWSLACLTKGAGVVILPAVLLPTYYLLFRPKSWLKLIGRHVPGILIFAVVGLSWYVKLTLEDPAFLYYFLVEQTINRYASDQWQRAQPWGFYLLTVSATALPWFWLLLVRIRKLPWKRWHVFLFVWIVGPLLFYSFAQSKLILYVLPIYSGLALLSVPVLEGLSERVDRRLGLGLSILFGVLLMATLVIATGPVGPLHLLWGAIAGAVLAGSALWSSGGDVGMPAGYRILLPALLFNLLLLPISAEFLSQNELLVNSTSPVTEFLRSGGISDRPVYLLHRRLPSVTFDLRKPATLLYAEKIGRDTTRQDNRNWRNYYHDVSEPNTRRQLRLRWAAEQSVGIGYQSQDSLDLDLLRPFQHQENIGRYTIYY
ncbi:glycosyltransferase family 39 protein [Lewinella sp. JB7]|uniref:ArnT family glycosyltransferase n=1 Tax=Lewinella sp. JB7 TaxID=2962887 RepID=UPI0020C9D429|nr:glycosyltransferase family 39 protein [Lewinella sp. JB7]MCP9234737.1 glycosyltransferase family 39 protein [Lewinella sp. JB7]